MKTIHKLLTEEAKGIKSLIGRIDEPLKQIADLCLQCQGRVIITGLGKSGLIGQKIAATLASTGTAAFFVHAADAQHGDLGMVTDKDVVIMISKSGKTDEVVGLIPHFKKINVNMVAITGNPSSRLAQEADICLDIGVDDEGEPFGLIPTTSSVVTLAVGDALAVLMMQRQNFEISDFAEFHPAGNLGLMLKEVEEIMHTGEEIPAVNKEATFSQGIIEMTRKKLGVTILVDGNKLSGIFTDGDIRRTIQNYDGPDLANEKLRTFATSDPINITPEVLVKDALYMMENNKITSLPVVETEESKKIEGLVHIHDILGREFTS